MSTTVVALDPLGDASKSVPCSSYMLATSLIALLLEPFEDFMLHRNILMA